MNRKLLLSPETGEKFKQIFGVSIKNFFNEKFALIGIIDFDIIAFDEWLKVPDGTSTRDFIIQKYSKEAAEFIKSLL